MPNKSSFKRAAVIVASASLVTGAVVSSTGATASGASKSAKFVRSCAVPKPGYAACDALRSLRAKSQANASPNATVSGYGPSDLQSAYNLASAAAAKGGTQTVALVDAYDDPNAESDLAVYRSQFGLSACTSASGCFAKVPGSGSTLPSADGGWAQEESLDIDMVSAICPNCKIRLVEALSNSTLDLAIAENTAASIGATEISNSYGGSESASDPATVSNYFTHPGVLITASAGDGGYGVEFPAASPTVLAVGGTKLSRASNSRGWTETVWGHGASSALLGGTGSGCSKYEAKPSWQHDSGCSKRMVGDIAADADPNTGVAVYDSTPYRGQSGWLVFGGTSVASPIIASVGALTAATSTHPTVKPGAYLYAPAGGAAHVYDVTSGSNGTCTGSPAYFCNGESGYDGPTGLGTPNGNAAVL